MVAIYRNSSMRVLGPRNGNLDWLIFLLAWWLDCRALHRSTPNPSAVRLVVSRGVALLVEGFSLLRIFHQNMSEMISRGLG